MPNFAKFRETDGGGADGELAEARRVGWACRRLFTAPCCPSALQRLLAKRKAEASPAVSPEKGDRPADASLASELADRLALDEAKGETAAGRSDRASSCWVSAC